jgi:HAD superfamily hydrolase (TIGR01484 family)
MRIAASDYDGTMYLAGKLLGDVVGAVTAWRAAGNIFVIVTGREYGMIVSEIERWGIPVDSLICLNGAAIYGVDGSLQQYKYIPDAVLPALLRHPAVVASMHIQLSSSTEPLRVFLRETSWFPRLGVTFARVEYEEALDATGLGQISLAYEDGEACTRCEAALRRDFGDAIDPNRNKTTIDVNVAGVDKASGIDELLRLRGWEGRDVYTIGDGGNDLGMIRKFGGFTVPGAQAEVGLAAKKVYADLADMLANV